MFLQVAAAADETGRVITMLTAGLVAIALGLAALTVWYWRFTNPRRQPAALLHTTDAAPDATPIAAETAAAPTAAPIARNSVPAETGAVPVVSAATVATDVGLIDSPESLTVVDDREPTAVAEPQEAPPHGLDGEQWEMLTQAVFERFLDSPADGD